MLMPDRHGYKVDGGWASGNDQVNGNNVPQTLTVDNRNSNNPTEYKASQWIEITDGFESGTSDEFVAYIADGTNTTGGNTTGSGGQYNVYRYGFNGKENDDEVKGEGNNVDFGARVYDGRVAKWLSVDPLMHKYPSLTPYNFSANNPILFINVDGRVIGNPNDPKVKELKSSMLKTTTGAKIWKQMEQTKRVINIQFHNTQDPNDKLYDPNAGYEGLTTTTSDYNSVINGKGRVAFSKKYEFDPSIGDYKKTKEWDNTTIIIDEAKVETGANALKYYYKKELGIDISDEYAREIYLGQLGTHEGTHSVQKRADFWQKTKDKNGKYIDHQKKGDQDKFEYDEERDKAHEKEAYDNGDNVRDELEKKDLKEKKKG
jgi:RHS repeat-associated protein